ncbi:DegT/DnrJ/EryC1/StrS family aminotransferase [Cellulomonas oligotrophica]|nr:aminotransferase class I/II-fold pyridoxal phosphate-dependent enzyme [Cellulomonas oligotrophica]NYD87405.1 dTDP-4-amino-4,6-dideoxygalactose transaminase [Cellulomonas oligotrophica]
MESDRDRLGALLRASVSDPGQVLDDLEAEVRRRTGAGHAVLCNSGTDALVALLLAAGIGPGDEVVVPAYSFFATASCVVHAGATPVFADIDPRTYALTAETVRPVLTERTAAVLVVHLFHQTADTEPLVRLTAEHGVLLLEDSAEAVGMSRHGVHAGLLGAGGVLSFFPTKTWGALGDCGVLVTDDPQLAARARAAVSVGDPTAGWPSAPDAVQAAVLLARAPRLDDEIAHRQQLANLYGTLLAHVHQVTAPRVVAPPEVAEPVWYVYLVEAERRDALAEHLARHGIGTEVYYPRALPDQPCLAADAVAQVPVARAAATRALALPLYADLTPDDVRRVVRHVVDFYATEDPS